MKALVVITAIAAVLAGSLAAGAAPRTDRLDGYKLFDDIANRAGQ